MSAVDHALMFQPRTYNARLFVIWFMYSASRWRCCHTYSRCLPRSS